MPSELVGVPGIGVLGIAGIGVRGIAVETQGRSFTT